MAKAFNDVARDVGIELRNANSIKDGNAIYFTLTNGIDYIRIYCTPNGFITETYYVDGDEIVRGYSCIHDVRICLQKLAKQDFFDAS